VSFGELVVSSPFLWYHISIGDKRQMEAKEVERHFPRTDEALVQLLEKLCDRGVLVRVTSHYVGRLFEYWDVVAYEEVK